MAESRGLLVFGYKTELPRTDFSINNILRNVEADALRIIEKAGRASAYDLVKQLGEQVSGVSPDSMYDFLKLLASEAKLREVNDQGFGQGNTHLIEFARRYPEENRNQI